jgi:hypothetical protein
MFGLIRVSPSSTLGFVAHGQADVSTGSRSAGRTK